MISTLYFKTEGAYIGGIYPFILPNEFKSKDLKKISWLDYEFTNSTKILELRNKVFEPDFVKSRDLIYRYQSKINYINLNSDNEIRDINLQAYLFTYSNNFASIIYWLDFSGEILTYDEIIEVAAIVKGTKLRYNDVKITYKWFGTTKEVNSLTVICKLMIDRIYSEIQGNSYLPSIEVCHPLIYLNCIPDCKNISEIFNKYSTELHGILGLWNKYEKNMLLVDGPKSLIKLDFHPFNYGISLPSIIASIEVHSNNIKRAAQYYNMSIDNMHFEERFDWVFQIEESVVSYFILRSFNSKIKELPIIRKGFKLFNPILIFILLFRAIKYTKELNKYRSSLEEFLDVYQSRRNFTNQALQLYSNEFKLGSLMITIEKKVDAMQIHLNTIFNMISSIIIFILSLISLLIAFLTFF